MRSWAQRNNSMDSTTKTTNVNRLQSIGLKTKDEWGEVCLHKVVEGDEFWAIMDDVFDDTKRRTGFGHNRNRIVEAYRDGNFYSLMCHESKELFDNHLVPWRRHAFKSPDIMSQQWGQRRKRIHMAVLRRVFFSYMCGAGYIFPCFCIPDMDAHTVEFVWVHPRARRMGLASCMLRLLNITSVGTIAPRSVPFWKAIGFQSWFLLDSVKAPKRTVILIGNGVQEQNYIPK